MERKAFNTIGIIIGIAVILVGIFFALHYKEEAFYHDKYGGGVIELGGAAFGADFYTEIYEAVAFSGNAIKAIYELLSTFFGIFFIVIGSIDICFFLSIRPKCKKSKDEDEITKEISAIANEV